jgi:predicted MFS family arabinose efflux permease
MIYILGAGAQLGKIIAMPLTGLILAAFGWKLVFYIFGLSGVILYVTWVFVVNESPQTHPTISDDELRHISESIGSERHHSVLY